MQDTFFGVLNNRKLPSHRDGNNTITGNLENGGTCVIRKIESVSKNQICTKRSIQSGTDGGVAVFMFVVFRFFLRFEPLREEEGAWL